MPLSLSRSLSPLFALCLLSRSLSIAQSLSFLSRSLSLDLSPLFLFSACLCISLPLLFRLISLWLSVYLSLFISLSIFLPPSLRPHLCHNCEMSRMRHAVVDCWAVFYSVLLDELQVSSSFFHTFHLNLFTTPVPLLKFSARPFCGQFFSQAADK